jgi:hypothetical protein
LENKTKKIYEKNCVFQNTWACWFPWAELIFGENGLIF